MIWAYQAAQKHGVELCLNPPAAPAPRLGWMYLSAFIPFVDLAEFLGTAH